MALAELGSPPSGIDQRGELSMATALRTSQEHWKFLLRHAAPALLDPRVGIKMAQGVVEAEREARNLFRSHTFLGHGVPRGNGDTVIPVPGLGGGDVAYAVAALWLQNMGYDARPSGIKLNVGSLGKRIQELEETVDRVTYQTGKPVILDCHSIGGVYGKIVALRKPDSVKTLITNGSPLVTPEDKAQSVIHRIADRFIEGFVNNEGLEEELGQPLQEHQRFVSIFSRRDHIVRPEATHDPDAEMVEVDSSHLGMPFNAHVYRDWAELLAA